MKKAIVLIALIVLIAGCITERSVRTDANNGLQVNEFSADLDTMYDNEDVTIYLEVENVGGTTANDAKARLYGIDSWNISGSNVRDIGDLEKPDIVTGVPGEFDSVMWTITPPNLPEGLQQPFKVSSRVRYEYYSNSVTNIDVISRAQYDLLRKTGELEQVPVTSTNTNGPIKIDVEVMEPIKLDAPAEGSINKTEKNVLIYVRNVGDGIPFGGDVSNVPDWPDDTTIGKLELEVKTPGAPDSVELKECFGREDSTKGNTGLTDVEITLRSGYESYKGVCTLVIPDDFADAVPTETITLTIESTYGYYIDTPLDVTVISSR